MSTAAATGSDSPSPSRSVSAGWQPTIQLSVGNTPSAPASMKVRAGVV